MSQPTIPPYHVFMWPALQATKALGGSATVREMTEKVIEDGAYSEELQAVPHGNGRMSELEYRLHWARTHLKGIGALVNSSRGVWAITDHGLALDEKAVENENKAWRAELLRGRKERRSMAAVSEEEVVDEQAGATWKDTLIARLLDLPPDGFERMCQRILREAGFVNVTVTGKSGDGGIDGVGVYRLSLVSFPIYFQCKRYRGSVSSGAVRDFRGAMVGRGEKGLLITTGSFTRDAQQEASRDGAPPVELIDGEHLCDLLREYRLGVSVVQRIEEDVLVSPEFFDEYEGSY